MNLISTSKDIQNLCNKLSKEKFICIDTEFIREKYYFAKLCLLQIGDSNGKGWAIDTLKKDIDLSPIYSLFFNPQILKVFHAPRQDLEIIYKLTKKIPYPIFDTQIAGMASGFGDSVSYEKLVNILLDTTIDKSTRYSDWSIRPLKKEQINYALKDVTYLSKIYLLLNDQINKKNRSIWIKEEVEKFYNTNLYENDPYEAWKKIKTKKQNIKVLKILREICAMREKIAIKMNMQKSMVLKDEHLLKLAIKSPGSLKELSTVRGFPNSKISQNIKIKIIQAIRKGEICTETNWLQRKKNHKNQSSKEIIKLLNILLTSTAKKHNISARLIATKDDLEEISSGNKESRVLKGWRYEIFGETALKILGGKIAVSYKNDKIMIKKI